MLTPDDHDMSPWVAYEQAMLDKQYAAMRAGAWEPTARQFYTGNASVERRHVVAAGGFDTSFSRAEDVELAYRLAALGLRFVFDPDAIGHHYAERSYESWRRTPYLYGRNDVIFTRDRGQTWLLPQIRREFSDHHRLIRIVTTAAVDRPVLRRILIGSCELIARTSVGQVRRAALSVVYNVMYYQGIADELGSSRWLTGRDSPDAVTAGLS
jgi:GT2 family glycosyltransferase